MTPGFLEDLTVDLTPDEQSKLGDTITDVLGALRPADGPLDAGIRKRMAAIAKGLTTA